MRTEIEFLKESNAIEGVYDHKSLEQAELAWNFLTEQKVMSVHVICKVHKILMLNHPLLPDERGYFRRRPVYIGGQEALHPLLVPDHMKQWILNCNDLAQNGKWEHELWKERTTKLHHVNFETIHPFIDGNGRVGRMLLNWERLQLGMPILVIREDERQEYYKWFRGV